MENTFFETEIVPGYMSHSEQYGMLRVVITRRRNCERLNDTSELLRYLADALDKVVKNQWLVDHVTVDTYNGHAVAYLRPNA